MVPRGLLGGHFRVTLRVNLGVLLDNLGGTLWSLGEYFRGTLGSVLEHSGTPLGNSRNTFGVL